MEAAAPREKVVTAKYDFDDNGGLVSTIGLNAFIPGHSIIQYHVTLVDLVIAAGAGATIAVGFTGNSAGLMGATAFASFANRAALNGVAFATASLYIPLAVEITTTIAVNPVSAGSFHVNVEVLQLPTPIS